MAINGSPDCSWLKPYTLVKISGIEARKPNSTAKLKDTYIANEITIGSVSSMWIGRKTTTVIVFLRSAMPVGVGVGGSGAPPALARF
jgi:hypothetical protein